MTYLRRHISLTVLTLLILLAYGLDASHAVHENLGEVSGSGDTGRGYSYVYVGGHLQLNCTLNSSDGWQASDIIFTRENDFGDVTLPQSEVTIINNRTAQLNHEVRGKQDAGEYLCWIETAQDHSYVHVQEVYVQYRPQLSSMSCEVKDWDDRLTCFLNFGVQYVNNSAADDLPVPEMSVHVMLIGQKNVLFSSDDICGQPESLYSGSSECVLSGDQFRAPTKYVWQAVVTNEITKEKNMSYLLINNREIVKPSPVSRIWVEDVNSTCVSLAWTHTFSKTRGMFYNVSVSSGISELVYNRSGHFCGLSPYTQYTVSVECHPYDSDQNQSYGFWSDARSHSFTTEMSVPESSFPVAGGSYLRGPCRDGERKIFIYWKEVPPSKRNGEIIGYQLRYNGTTVDVDVLSPTSAVLSVTCDTNFLVRIFSRTKVGPSKTNSKLFIFSDEGKPTAEFAVEVLDKGVRVVWDNTTDTETVITVFWCPRDKTTLDRTCKGEIQWVSAPFSAGQVDITQDVHPYDYLFGVSRESHGISWADCYFRSKAPMKALEVVVKALEGRLDVAWRVQQCSDHYPVHTTGYRLYYCQQNQCQEPPEVVEIKGVEKNHYSIGGQPGVAYNITMQAVDHSGRLGPLSPPDVEAIPLTQASFPLWGLLAIVVLVLLTVCLVILYIWWCRRKVKQEMAKFGRENIEWRLEVVTYEGGTSDTQLPTFSPSTTCSFPNPLAEMDSDVEDTACQTAVPDRPQAALRDAYHSLPSAGPLSPNCHREDDNSAPHIPLVALDGTEAAAGFSPGSDETELSSAMVVQASEPGCIAEFEAEPSSVVGGQEHGVTTKVHTPDFAPAQNSLGRVFSHNGGGGVVKLGDGGIDSCVDGPNSCVGLGDGISMQDGNKMLFCFDTASASSHTSESDDMVSSLSDVGGVPLPQDGKEESSLVTAKTGSNLDGYSAVPPIACTGQTPSVLPVSNN